MQRAINRALSGDEEALDLLDVADEQVIPSIRTITPQTLQADYKYACRQYLAAMQLQLRGMERIAKKYILTLFWINTSLREKPYQKNSSTYVTRTYWTKCR